MKGAGDECEIQSIFRNGTLKINIKAIKGTWRGAAETERREGPC